MTGDVFLNAGVYELNLRYVTIGVSFRKSLQSCISYVKTSAAIDQKWTLDVANVN